MSIFLIIYIISTIASLPLSLMAEKSSRGYVTVGKCVVFVFLSFVPIMNSALVITAAFYLLINLEKLEEFMSRKIW